MNYCIEYYMHKNSSKAVDSNINRNKTGLYLQINVNNICMNLKC